MIKYILYLILFCCCFRNGFADYYLQKGNELCDSERYFEAISYYKQSKEKDLSTLQILNCEYDLRQLDSLEYKILQFRQSVKNDSIIECLDVLRLSFLGTVNEFDKALQLANTFQPVYLYNKIDKYQALVKIYLKKSDFETANLYNQKIEELLPNDGSFEHTVRKGLSLKNQGDILYYESDFAGARIAYQAAKTNYLKFQKQTIIKVAKINFDIALICLEEKKNYEAIALLTATLKVYKERFGEFYSGVAECYGLMGTAYANNDELDKALDYFERDRAISEKIYGVNHIEVTYAYFDIGTVYNDLKDYYHAEQYLLKSLAIKRKFLGEINKEVSENYLELIYTYIGLKDYTKAMNFAKKVEYIEKQLKTPNSIRMADLYYLLGLIKKGNKLYDDAIQYLNKSLALYIEITDDESLDIQSIYLELAEIKLIQQKFNEALSDIKKSMSKKSQNIYYTAIPFVQFLKTNYEKDKYFKTFDVEKYERYIKILIKITNIMLHPQQTYLGEKANLSEAEVFAQITQVVMPILRQLYTLSSKSEYLEWMFFFIESNKANVLYQNTTIKSKTNQIILDKIEDYKTEIDKLRQQETPNLELIYKLEKKLSEYKEKFGTTSKKEKLFALKMDYSVWNVQQKLQKDMLFLNYYTQGDEVYLIAISKTTIKFYTTKIDSKINDLLESISTKKYNRKLAEEVCKMLIPSDVLLDKTTLIISADKQLHNLPFEALYYKNKYLIEHFLIINTLSSKMYFSPPSAKKISNKMMVIAPDFNGTKYPTLQNKEEMLALEKMYNGKFLWSKDATISNFLQYKNKVGILHLATHTQLDSLIPMHSAIVFQPDSSQNYLFKISDIVSHSFGQDLVSLGACSGSFGKESMGEGILNFSWAFQFSGVKNVLVTKWQAADDIAKKLIVEFYRTVKKDNSGYASALRTAKLNYLKNTDAIGAEPYFWANFVIYSTIIPEKNYSIYLIFGIILIVVCFVSYLMYKKKNARSR